MMQITYDVDLMNRLAARFRELHQKQHLEKARALSSFLRRWSENARTTGRENVCENLLPAAIQRLTAMYPGYGSSIRSILKTILIDEDIDWQTITDELYRMLFDYSLKPQRATTFGSAA